MSPKIAAEHLARGAVVYVRQSTATQVAGNLESQRLQYGLADAARAAGFVEVNVIDEDLGRSGSGLARRPGFQRLVAGVCSGAVGAVYCIEASRLARNGRDWHHLIDLCALTGVLVIDPDGVYDPRLMNGRLLLRLKGTMSEYELNLLRQRGIAARDAKAGRGALRFTLPPGFRWSEDDRIEIDPDERVQAAIRLVFDRFRELGSARQVFLWVRNAGLQLPVVRRNGVIRRIEWRAPANHSVVQVLHNPLYAGAYVFGRSRSRTRVVDGRAVKTDGLVEEIVISLDDVANEAVVVVHWIGGRHTTCRIPRRRAGGYPSLPQPDAVEVMRRLGGRWPDRELAVTLNRMRCKTPDGETWTTVRAAELRQRLGIPEYARGPDPRRRSARMPPRGSWA